jgi:hypothetical protein
VTTGADPEARPGSRRGTIVVGIVLILLGAVFLIENALNLDIGRFGWPLFVIVPGVILLGAGLAAGPREGPGMAIGGGIITTVGLILAVQNVTGLWATWAYAWALVGPGGTGLGLVAYGLARGDRGHLTNGLRSFGVGIALFAAFGLFFEGIIGLSGEPFLASSDVLPIVLIGLGVVLVGASLLRGRRPA